MMGINLKLPRVTIYALFAVAIVHASLLVHETHAAPKPKAAAPRADGNPLSMELNERGATALRNKNYRDAEELLVKAVAADPNNLTAVYNLAGAYLVQQKESAAVSLLNETVQKHQDDPGLYARLGDGLFATKNITGAAAAYENTLKIDAGYPGIPAKLATAYMLTNRPKDAETMLILATKQDPKNQKLLANLSSLYLGNGKADQAIITAKRALQLRPEKEVYITLGTAYEISKDYKNALIAFQRAADLGDDRPELKKKIAGLKDAVS